MSCLLNCGKLNAGYNQVPLDDYLDDLDHDPETSEMPRSCCMCTLKDALKNLNCSQCCSCTKYSLCCEGKKRSQIFGIILSVSLLVIVPVISISLGCYSLFVLEPLPVIDKSIHAFAIPNHQASLNYDAFKVASVKNVSHSSRTIPHFFTCTALFNESQEKRWKRSTFDRHWLKSFSLNNIEMISSTSWNSKAGARRKRSSHSGSGGEKDSYDMNVFHYQYHPQWKMQVVFLAVGDEDHNMFTKERLETVHKIEQDIINHPQFKNFCLKDILVAEIDPAVRAQNSCAPLNSLLTYFYPSKDSHGNRHYDGLGSSIVDINSALKLAFNTDRSYYYVDEKVNRTYHRSRLLRTEVQFGTPLKGYDFPSVDIKEQSKKFKNFVITYIDTLSKASTEKVQVLYGGTELFDFQVDETFWNDVRLAYFTFGSVVLIMLILTCSLWLTFWGVASIILCFPCAFFVYRYMFGIQALGILNGVAAFVVIGIGVDDVFVFVNIFRQSSGLTCLRRRILHTVVTAGKATFFTSFTTAAAFAANMASSIPAVHQFGLFMSLVVSCCWMTVVLIMPPVLYLWSLTASKCEKAIAKVVSRACCRSHLMCNFSLPADMAGFIRGQNKINRSPSHIISQDRLSAPDLQQADEDVDVPMLVMDDPMEQFFEADFEAEDDDVPMLGGDMIIIDRDTDDLYAGWVLQWISHNCIAKPVIKARLVIIVVAFVSLCVSIGLMTQLQPATKPPQIFREDTNLQMLLDLKSNLSIDTVSCPTCSAIYHVNDHETPASTKKVTFTTPAPIAAHTVKPVTNINITTAATHLLVKPTKFPFMDPAKKTAPILHHKTTSTQKPLTTKQQSFQTTFLNTATPAYTSTTPVYDACENRDCSNIKDRPLLESGAVVHVVFGIKGIDRSKVPVGHVLDTSLGEVEFDSKFKEQFTFGNSHLREGLRTMCLICQRIANNTDLVRKGSAQCFPSYMPCLSKIPECRQLKQTYEVLGKEIPSRFVGGLAHNTSGLLWWSFGFESTTSKGESYFVAFQQYLKWEALIQEIKDMMLDSAPGLETMFQTSEFWTKVLMEVVAVNSAIYGLVLSMVICLVAVALFTGHVVLLFIVFISILHMICLVVGIFYLVGWEMGGVEAISLSVLVGSSVDYCVHLVEGYLLAGRSVPSQHEELPSTARRWRTRAAITHIGVSILSSALTTIVAAIPLTQTIIQPFAKFGQIVAINSTVCIVYSLTLCPAYLATIAPGKFVSKWKSYAKALIGTITVMGLVALALYVISKSGVFIPSPNGEALFPK